MLKTLFDPRGELSGPAYWKIGWQMTSLYFLLVLLLSSAMLFIGRETTPEALGVKIIATLAMVFNIIVFVYVYACIYGKRLKSARRSRYWLIVLIPGFYAMWMGSVFLFMETPLYDWAQSFMVSNVILTEHVSVQASLSWYIYMTVLMAAPLLTMILFHMFMSLLREPGAPQSNYAAQLAS